MPGHLRVLHLAGRACCSRGVAKSPRVVYTTPLRRYYLPIRKIGVQGARARLNSNVLNSQAVAQSFSKYGTYLLSQAFPEGSPYHPSYPTGHGTVGGACITLLKFFFDGSHVWPNPMAPSSDGLSLVPYAGSDAGQITVNGELNKLAHNVSYGHGIHAGIHWRSDTEASMLSGEAMRLASCRTEPIPTTRSSPSRSPSLMGALPQSATNESSPAGEHS